MSGLYQRASRRALAGSIALVLVLSSHAAFAGAAESLANGVNAFQNGNYPNAVTLLKASMDAKPSAKAGMYLGNAYLKLGQIDPAREAFARVLELEPDHPKKEAIVSLIQDLEARVEVKLRVDSTPPGAKVFVDSEAKGTRGTTPAEIDVTIGRRTIILVLDGYATATREEVIVPGKPVDMTFALEGRGCDVALSAKGPPAARASIDGADTVALPTKTLMKKGEHQIVFTSPTFEPQTLPFVCDGFKPAALEAALVLQMGRLALPTGPGTVIRIDGKLVALSADDAVRGVGLSPGRHEVAVTVGDEPTRTTIVDVGAGESVRLGLPAEKGADAFPSRALYFEMGGGGNIALRDWKLGSNAFQDQTGQTRLAPGSSGMAGVRIGYQVTPRFAVETEVSWLALPNQLDTSHGVSYSANVLYHLLPGRFTPIVQGGAGVYQVVSGLLGTDLSGRGHLGVGFRGRVARWLSLRADVRDVISSGFETGGANNLEMLAGAEILLR